MVNINKLFAKVHHLICDLDDANFTAEYKVELARRELLNIEGKLERLVEENRINISNTKKLKKK